MTVKRRKNLLIELGTEELPPKSLKVLGDAFADNFFAEMVRLNMVEDKPENYQPFATPRRLAIWVKGVKPRQPDSIEQKRGPSLAIAFDEQGRPTRVALGFAKSCGVEVKQLKKIKTPQGQWIGFEKKVKGLRLNEVVENCLQKTIKQLPIAKRMRWGEGEVAFVRPVHWLLALHGSDMLKVEALGLKSNRMTYGHRVHSQGAIVIPSADRYEQVLKTKGFVISDYNKRKAVITKQLLKQLDKSKAEKTYDESLLDEVCGLVECPVVMVGAFDSAFLKLPREVLISTMAQHQKYFYMQETHSRLMASFAFVSNIKSRSPKRVREGNERVLSARLADAEFFWNNDQKMRLEDRLETLKEVLFHQKLGSIYDKTKRIEQLSKFIAVKLNRTHQEVEDTARTALLCKTDLVTEMVGEFPELQGVMGRYYAKRQAENPAVVKGIEQHYLPRFSGDKTAHQNVAQCVAIADRIDTLTGIFLCGEVPSGEKDPYALRRAALGVLRTVIEHKLNLDVAELIAQSETLYSQMGIQQNEQNDSSLINFINERLKGYLLSKGYLPQHIEAVLTVQSKQPLEIVQRLDGLKKFLSIEKADAESLIGANKRIANMLSKFEEGYFSSKHLDTTKLVEHAEKTLFKKIQSVKKEMTTRMLTGHYVERLSLLSTLKPHIDQFFDEVTIMHDDPAMRENRLVLLYEVRMLFLNIADISKIPLSA